MTDRQTATDRQTQTDRHCNTKFLDILYTYFSNVANNGTIEVITNANIIDKILHKITGRYLNQSSHSRSDSYYLCEPLVVVSLK